MPQEVPSKSSLLKLGNNLIEDHIARYKILLKKTKVHEDTPHQPPITSGKPWMFLPKRSLWIYLLHRWTSENGTTGILDWIIATERFSRSCNDHQGRCGTEGERNWGIDGRSKKGKEITRKWTLMQCNQEKRWSINKERTLLWMRKTQAPEQRLYQ
jgi:hypothetical protein